MTINELFKKYSDLCQFEEGPSEYLINDEDFKNAVTEFTQYHVEQALLTASEKASAYKGWDSKTQDNEAIVNKESILNCYPKENIV